MAAKSENTGTRGDSEYYATAGITRLHGNRYSFNNIRKV
jgi:hypothetical protein